MSDDQAAAGGGQQSSLGLLKEIYARLLDFVFPPQCVVCDELHDNQNFFICRRCESGLQKLDQAFCFECRLPLNKEDSFCPACGGKQVIKGVVALTHFDKRMRALIHAFKYSGLIPVGKYLGQLLAKQVAHNLAKEKLDLIVPVPLFPSRERKRGFNQSLIMAQELSRNLKIVSEPKALYRTRATRDQTGLNRPERIENMRGAFVVAPSARLKDLSILLVDDVTTTGATAREAALALGAGGAKKIFLAVAAVAGEDFQQ